MLTITPIGSCRVATPLRLCRESHGFRMNMTRIWGYTHSSSEAVQQMRYLKGEFEPDERVWPLISPKWQTNPRLREPFEPSDLYIVEISSQKQMQLDGAAIQLNYLRQAYADFFADPERAKAFNRLTLHGSEAERRAFLAEHWGSDPRQREEADLLARIEMTRTDEAALIRDMEELEAGLGEVLFVTHVNARDNTGERLAGRDRFIETVKAAGRKIGARVYDPTALMEQFGQERAIEDHSTALAHFTEPFSEAVLDDWYERFIHDQIAAMVSENPEDAIERVVVPHAEAFIATGDADKRDEVKLLLEAVESYFPANPEAKRLRLELAIVDGSEAEVKRAFFQVAMNSDLSALGKLGELLATLPMIEEWAEELKEAPVLNAGSAGWLARILRGQGREALALALENRM